MTASQEDNFSHPFEVPCPLRKGHQKEEIPHKRGGYKDMSDGTEMILSGWAGLKALWLSSLSSTGDRPNLRSRWGSSNQAVCSLVWHDSAKYLSPEEFLIPDEIMLFCFVFVFFFSPGWEWRVPLLWGENLPLEKGRLAEPLAIKQSQGHLPT